MCFYFSSFGFTVYRMHHVNMDMRMHAQIWGKKEVRTFSPPKMPLVISCTFLGNGNTTSVPISVSFTQIRGPKERVATALYQPLQSHHYSQIWSWLQCSRADCKKTTRSPLGLFLFIYWFHLLVSFDFCLIFTEWKSLIQYILLLVYLTYFKMSMLSCISFYTIV